MTIKSALDTIHRLKHSHEVQQCGFRENVGASISSGPDVDHSIVKLCGLVSNSAQCRGRLPRKQPPLGPSRRTIDCLEECTVGVRYVLGTLKAKSQYQFLAVKLGLEEGKTNKARKPDDGL